MRLVILFSFLMGMIAACGGSYFEEDIITKYPDGLELYKSKCGGCHRLHNREEFTAGGWDSVLVPMQKKSKINNEQRVKIFRFLTETDTSARVNLLKN